MLAIGLLLLHVPIKVPDLKLFIRAKLLYKFAAAKLHSGRLDTDSWVCSAMHSERIHLVTCRPKLQTMLSQSTM